MVELQYRIQRIEHLCEKKPKEVSIFWDASCSLWFKGIAAYKEKHPRCPYCEHFLKDPLIFNLINKGQSYWYNKLLNKEEEKLTLFIEKIDKRTLKGKKKNHEIG